MRELRTRCDVLSSLFPFRQKRFIGECQQICSLRPSRGGRRNRIPFLPQRVERRFPFGTLSFGGLSRLAEVLQFFKQLHEPHPRSSPYKGQVLLLIMRLLLNLNEQKTRVTK